MRTVAQEMEREGLSAAAADRRRDHVARPHRRPPRAGVQRPGRPRPGCVARGWRRSRAARRGRARRVRRRDPRDSYAELRRQFAERDDRTRRLTIEEARANRLRARLRGRPRRGRLHRLARAARCRARRARAATSTGRRSSPPGSCPATTPRSSTDPRLGSAARALFADAQELLAHESSTSACCTQRRRSASGRPAPRPTTTSSSSPTRRGRPSSSACTPCASRWPSRSVGRTLPWPTSSPPLESGIARLRRCLRRHRRRWARRGQGEACHGGGRRLLGHPPDVARRPPRRGRRRVAPRKVRRELWGYARRRGARQRGADRREVPAASGRRRAIRRSPTTPRSGRSSGCSTRSALPASA